MRWRSLIKRYILYLIRWQLSTPILAVIVNAIKGPVAGAVTANFVGGLIFFWVDRFIFTSNRIEVIWHYKDDVVCADCGKIVDGRRLVKALGYDRTDDPNPQFRCLECSNRKLQELRARGIEV